MKRIIHFLVPAIALLPIYSCNGPSGNPSVQPASSGDAASENAAARDAALQNQVIPAVDTLGQRTKSPNRDSNNYRSHSNGQQPAVNDNHAPGVNHRHDNLNNRTTKGTVAPGDSLPAGKNNGKSKSRTSSARDTVTHLVPQQ